MCEQLVKEDSDADCVISIAAFFFFTGKITVPGCSYDPPFLFLTGLLI